MKRSIIKSKYTYSLVTILFFLVLWIILANIYKNTFVFPSLSMILKGAKVVFIENTSMIFYETITLFVSLILSILIASLMTIIYIAKKDLIGFFTPILSFMHVVPTLAIGLYLYFFLDSMLIPVILVIMVTVPIITEGLITAYDNIDNNITDALRLEKISFFKKIIKIYIPLIMPYFLMTLLQSISLGIKAMIMGEFIASAQAGANLTIGKMLYAYQEDTGVIVFMIIILFIISVLCEIIIKILQSKITHIFVK